MRRFLLTLVSAFCLSLVTFPLAHADVNDFTITDFSADYYLSQSDPQGAMTIKEHLDVDFTDYNHGILRAIPKDYNGQSSHLKISKVLRDNQNESYSMYDSNGNEVLKIGSADKTITGNHSYEIDYSVQNVIRFDGSTDDLIWNVNGTGWEQPFLHITAYLHIPSNLTAKVSSPVCYTGIQGSTDHKCDIAEDTDSITYSTVNTLGAGETLTISASLPKGTFSAPTAADWWADHIAQILEIVLLPLAVLVASYLYWRKNGKDLKGRGTIIPEYTPPKDLRAAEADVINHYKLSTKAISATIIDLAIRKHLKITETMSDGVLGIGKHKEYTLTKLSAPVKNTLKPFESTILDGLFSSGDTVKLKDLAKKFYTTSQSVQKTVPLTLTADGYFPSNPKKVGNAMHILGLIAVIGGFSLIGALGLFGVGLILSGAILFGFGLLMPRRTQKGVEAKESLEGLKMYMNVAEKDRIAMLQSPDAPYADKSVEPIKTVDLFEKLLPFAMVMGVEQQWAKKFDGIYTTPPDWYAGNWASFNAGYLVGSLNDSMSAMNTAFAPPSSSSSGGGGGFSGGGGGGGGGGGW